ncbi:MAG: nitroreductase family protein [Candidatus Hydrogenedentes bacterium]|nr:nitroreductase family protein [Candidatus Hydrogenedentota bacterium]
MIRDLILKNRSYRRFHQDVAIEEGTLRELVDLARLSMSASNRQPLKYAISATPEKNAAIFPLVAWAGYLKDWDGPEEGERPTGYIVMLGDTELHNSFDCDCGIAAENIMLGAVEKGLGGCMMGSVQREKLRELLGIPERYQILLVLALGKPKEVVVLERAEGDIKYYRDADRVHHVPKRPLDEVLLD